jgi:hypothetical protein
MGHGAGVPSQKFFEEISDKNAGPSTAFGAKNAPNSAQDDSNYEANFRDRTLVWSKPVQ